MHCGVGMLPLKFQEGERMDKKEALRKLIASADAYKECLENKNLLIVYSNAVGECEFFETKFTRRQFRHLTGVDTSLSSSELYKRLLSRRLSTDDFELKADGTTELKLNILPKLLRFGSCARMVGELHSGSVMHLRTEKLAGGVVACMGFVADGRFYVPNTALNKDIREVTARPQYKILMILEKSISDPKYSKAIHTAKGFTADNLLGYGEICELIDFPV